MTSLPAFAYATAKVAAGASAEAMASAPVAVLLAAFAAATVTGVAVRRAAWLLSRRRDGGRRPIADETCHGATSGGPPARRRRPQVLVRLTQRLAPRVVAYAGRRDMRALIARAGLCGRVEPRDIAALRVLCVLAALLTAPRLVEALPHRMLPLALAVWLATAAEAPVWWLRRVAAGRASALRAALPDALELMRACLSAGLPLSRALLLVGDHCAEPVAGEFLCVAAETGLGISRATALDGLVARNPLPEMRALVSAMRQAERHGSPLAPVIAAQAEEARRAHDRAIVERGARAGPKIQLIVATTIVPAALVGLAAVVAAAFARGDLRFI